MDKAKRNKKKPTKRVQDDDSDDFDERFAEIKNDPRYLEMP